MDKDTFEKMLSDLDAVDFDDLGGDDFHGGNINAEKWKEYRQVVKAMLTLQGKDSKSVLKIHYLAEPDPAEDSAAVMIVLPQAVSLDADAKTAFALASLLCDHIAMTTTDNKTRVSFTVNNIWMNGGM